LIAVAATDRLVQHATTLETNVDSYRRREAVTRRRGEAVVPLTTSADGPADNQKGADRANHAGIVAMRMAEIGIVAPFRYTNLLWALLLGFAVFGDVPGWPTVAGAAIVAGTGLYTRHRERVTARRTAASALPATPSPASAACRYGARPAAPARREPR
jgi:hypothetical protein